MRLQKATAFLPENADLVDDDPDFEITLQRIPANFWGYRTSAVRITPKSERPSKNYELIGAFKEEALGIILDKLPKQYRRQAEILLRRRAQAHHDEQHQFGGLDHWWNLAYVLDDDHSLIHARVDRQMREPENKKKLDAKSPVELDIPFVRSNRWSKKLKIWIGEIRVHERPRNGWQNVRPVRSCNRH